MIKTHTIITILTKIILVLITLFLSLNISSQSITEVSIAPSEKNQFSNNQIPIVDDLLVNQDFRPVIDNVLPDNILFTYSFESKLEAYNLDSKIKIWSFESKDSVKGTKTNKFTIHKGTIYIPFENGEIHAINGLTGEGYWKSTTGINLKTSVLSGQKPVIFNEKVYITSSNKNVYALNIKNGELEWNYKLDYEYNHVPSLISHNKLFIPNAPFVYSFDAETGRPIYKRGFKRAMYSTPTSNSKSIFIANESDMLFALNPETLAILWEFTLEDNQYSIKEKLKTDEHNVYIATCSFGDSGTASVYCLNEANGEKKWKTNFKDTDIEYIKLFNNSIFGYTKKGLLFELDKNSGKSLQNIQLKNRPVSNLEMYKKDALLYFSKKGVIILNLKTKRETILFKVEKATSSETDSYIKLSNNLN